MSQQNAHIKSTNLQLAPKVNRPIYESWKSAKKLYKLGLVSVIDDMRSPLGRSYQLKGERYGA